ncbi:MAG: sigma-70 family RNA polymerase sigma factor [Anaerolineales bacterium]|jgi:RNA polymerase sigma-70 factor (ECF subfamily)
MDEEALIRTAKRGDLDAFNRLVIEYQGLAFNLAYRIMGDPSQAEDAAQEAFISAYKALRRFRGGSFRAWLMRIVTNACYDELRRLKRRPAASLDEITETRDDMLEDSQDPMRTGAPQPEHEAVRGELRQAIEECLGALADEFRIVAVLVDVQGYDYREAAQVIDIPVGTVKSRLARARGRLRDCLKLRGELLPVEYRLEDETD